MQKKSRSLNAKSTASLPRHGDPEGLLRRDQGAVPQGLLLHSAGFDTDGGVFRIFDVWQTREDGERFMAERLEPIIESMIAAATESGEDFAPPAREGWYELHDTTSG